MTFIEDIVFDSDKSFALSGGYACDFLSQPGFGDINGSLTITKGLVVIDGIEIDGCPSGFSHCSTLENGCQTNIASDISNCGGCGLTCAVANGTGACTGGRCGVGTCNAGFGNCDGSVANGCETNTNISRNHCGTCNNNCGTLPHVASATCTAGSCVITSCAPFWVDDDQIAANGCELNTAVTLSAFGPALSFTDVGQMGTATFPTPLTVKLSSAPTTDTFVAVTSGDPSRLTIVGGGVTVLSGTTTAPVLVNGLGQTPGVTLTATLSTDSLQASVRVVGPTEQPAIASLLPSAPTTFIGRTVTFTVRLDIPAPAGGTVVNLSLNPPNAGTIPATVTVPAHQLSATFNYADGAVVTSATITATLGVSQASSTITIFSQGLIINEVDYDQVGPDTMEFVEILNISPVSIPLAGYQLVLVNGSNNTLYNTIDLSPGGTLAAGQYLVIGSAQALANVEAGALTIQLPLQQDNIQNGAPDGLAIVNTIFNELVDALSYEGSITAASIPVLGTVSLVEGAALATADSNTVTGSLCRFPNGTDTNNAASDWNFCTHLTPGAASIQ